MRTMPVLSPAGILWIAALAFQALAQDQTVTGQIVDLGCYARNRANTTMDHDRGRECAWACVKWEGHPVGLVATDGKVYQLAGELIADNNSKVAPYLTQTVVVTGRVSERDGMAMLTAERLKMARE